MPKLMRGEDGAVGYAERWADADETTVLSHVKKTVAVNHDDSSPIDSDSSSSSDGSSTCDSGSTSPFRSHGSKNPWKPLKVVYGDHQAKSATKQRKQQKQTLDVKCPRKSPAAYSSLIGNTPLVDLSHLVESPKCDGIRVFAKCEFFNPGFSIKDRIVRNILDRAEAEGKLKPGGTIVVASSGNTGAATAMMCAMRGYQCVVTTCCKCSKEKMDAIKAYGAKLIVTPPGVKEGTPDHYMNVARRLVAQNEGWFDMDQYDNLRNPEGHYLTLGPEIWEQTNGTVTHFVAAGSTGGTVSGTGKYLLEQNKNIQVHLADPVGSIFTEYFRNRTVGTPKKFLVEGVGKGTIPGAMNFDVIHDVIPVTDQQAFDMCHKLARSEGICAGGSSGLNMHASLKLAAEQTKPCTIVTIMPDLGVKYLSKLYNRDWYDEHNLKYPDDVEMKGNFDLK